MKQSIDEALISSHRMPPLNDTFAAPLPKVASPSVIQRGINLWRTSDFVRKVLETYSTQISLMCLGLITTVAVTRVLGPEGRGLYAVAMAIGVLGVQFG